MVNAIPGDPPPLLEGDGGLPSTEGRSIDGPEAPIVALRIQNRSSEPQDRIVRLDTPIQLILAWSNILNVR